MGEFKDIDHKKWLVCPAEMYDIILRDGTMLEACNLWDFEFTHMETRATYKFTDAVKWRLCGE